MSSKELVLPGSVPDGLRTLIAQQDLERIRTQTDVWSEISVADELAVKEVLRADEALQIPYREAVHVLSEQFGENVKEKLTIDDVVRTITNTAGSEKGQKPSRVIRDVARLLHPDSDASNNESDVELFKAMTGAEASGNVKTLHQHYARVLSETSSETLAALPAELEERRAKAWVALQTSKPRFDTSEEVMQWRDTELKLLPMKARFGMAMRVAGLYIDKISDTDHPSRRQQPETLVYSFVQARQKMIKVTKLMEANSTNSGIVEFFDPYNFFDEDMGRLVGYTEEVLRSEYYDAGSYWTWKEIEPIKKMTDTLGTICQHFFDAFNDYERAQEPEDNSLFRVLGRNALRGTLN